MKICSHPPCGERAAAKDLCRRHYYQQRAGRALTMPITGDTKREGDRIVAAMKAQGGVCACCRETRIGVRLHMRGEDVLCDICMGILQFTGDAEHLHAISAYARAHPMTFMDQLPPRSTRVIEPPADESKAEKKARKKKKAKKHKS